VARVKVQELMTKEVFTVTRTETLNDAARIMWEHNCGCVPILSTDKGELIGVITDRDIAMASYINGAGLSDIPVMTAHSKRAIVVRPEDDIGAVESCMQANQIRRVPVIDEAARLVGIVSLNDIAIASTKQRSGVSAEEVSNTLGLIGGKRDENGIRTVIFV
jgi:CBS domain-containing protein